ncbi:MAG: hypothetical protein BV458_02265 [Thermoplasmata archaeon M9B2D]|nr:MAG: hypothetical protein BV458_02265 [Thermoplasmata archaeon M9B2D]
MFTVVVLLGTNPEEAALPKNRAETRIAINRDIVFASLDFPKLCFVFIKYYLALLFFNAFGINKHFAFNIYINI